MARIKGLNPDWIDFSSRIPQAKTDHITRQWRDIPYGNADLQKLDIYLPEEGDGPFPFIVNVHGGGLTACDKHDFHLYPTLFALEQGFAVVAVITGSLRRCAIPSTTMICGARSAGCSSMGLLISST